MNRSRSPGDGCAWPRRSADPVRCRALAALALAAAVLAPVHLRCQSRVAAPAPGEVAVTTTDGRLVRGRVAALRGDPGSRELALEVAGGRTEVVPLTRLLSIHGRAPEPSGPVHVHLVGGDRVCGELLGGDELGETLTIDSPTLGRVSLFVDRLAVVVFVERATGAGPGDLVVPISEEADEALFFRARRGFDIRLGILERFRARGVDFAYVGETEAELRAYSELSGIALRGGALPADPPQGLLVTASGDRIGAALTGGDGEALAVRIEGDHELRLPWSGLAVWTPLGDDRVFLSDLEPDIVDESSYLREGADVLYPYRRDRAVDGGPLVAGGLPAAKGIGVHSRSRLGFVVPDGMTGFHALVGVDDGVLALRGGLVADVDVRVLLDDEELFAATGLRSGAPPHDLGRLAVRPGAMLVLEVDYGGGMDLVDRVDWLQPVFLR